MDPVQSTNYYYFSQPPSFSSINSDRNLDTFLDFCFACLCAWQSNLASTNSLVEGTLWSFGSLAALWCHVFTCESLFCWFPHTRTHMHAGDSIHIPPIGFTLFRSSTCGDYAPKYAAMCQQRQGRRRLLASEHGCKHCWFQTLKKKRLCESLMSTDMHLRLKNICLASAFCYQKLYLFSVNLHRTP